MDTAEMYGRVILITGGSRGIGRGCAQAFCQAGARVVICARGTTAGITTAQELTAIGPGICHFDACDVRDTDALQQLVQRTVGLYGQLDCLVNNAGIHPPHKPIDEFSIAEFRELLNTNLVSYFAASKQALPYLRKAHGCIINMGSLVSSIGQQLATTYCATKGGISAFTKALAIEEARYGVRVNAILPGNIRTSAFDGIVPEAIMPLIESWQWLGHLGTIEDVGQACLFLANAEYITGVELIVSGGAELGYGIKAPKKIGLNLTEELYP